MPVVTRGLSELSLRFDTFPERAREKLEDRIRSLTDMLGEAVEEAAPSKTGRLRGEITPTLYADSENRIAGYVSVFASAATSEYAKAATLEYGTDKPRRARQEHTGLAERLFGGKERLTERVSRPVHIRAFRYLHDPFETMQPAIAASLDEAMAEAAAEGGE
jgi:hypothetical protein